MNHSRRHFAFGAVAFGAGLAGGWQGVAQAQTPSPAQSLPSEVRIGFQKGAPVLVLARKQQAIEKRLKPLGVGVKWVEFQFGPPMLEAIGAGAVDLGSVGDAPPIFAQAGGANLIYAAATAPSPHAVLVPKDSPIKTLADLRGKRIAIGKGSSAHIVAVKALAQAGLSLTKDVTPVYLAPADATAAFNGGNVDAWVVWDPYYAIAEQRYNARAIADSSDRRLNSSSYYIANRDFAQQQPKLLASVLDEIGQITRWADAHRPELATLAAEVTGIDIKTWAVSFARQGFSFGPVTPAHVQQQQEAADTFQSLGIIPRKINVADIVWPWPAK